VYVRVACHACACVCGRAGTHVSLRRRWVGRVPGRGWALAGLRTRVCRHMVMRIECTRVRAWHANTLVCVVQAIAGSLRGPALRQAEEVLREVAGPAAVAAADAGMGGEDRTQSGDRVQGSLSCGEALEGRARLGVLAVLGYLRGRVAQKHAEHLAASGSAQPGSATCQCSTKPQPAGDDLPGGGAGGLAAALVGVVEEARADAPRAPGAEAAAQVRARSPSPSCACGACMPR
jgi:hypothetical protein